MKAIWSKRRLTNNEDELAQEFMECVKDIIHLDEIKQLDNFVQHCNTSRLQHSLNVAYYSFLWAKKRGLDYKSVARAGILHDLYLYDWRQVETEQHHAFHHPKEALKNAEMLVELNEIEKDAIKNHMWPLSEAFPKYKESYILSWVDKYCAVVEVSVQLCKSILKVKMFSKKAVSK
ncbi:HD domain-containing protein [[Clostridium] colinum]|uniref:HD domain-containing protein n=1 Tax=[Clostridium] colinum TaxID=36835 RepID=UPI00202597F3|nr:HD domain-containing protein [[Clostridium] colinum]